MSPLGDIDICDEFVTQVLLNVTQGTGLDIPKRPFSNNGSNASESDVTDAILKSMQNEAQHSMYFCEFSAVGHHLIFETRQGRCRLFQAYVKGKLDISCGEDKIKTIKSGYSAKEWALKESLESWSPEMKAAHERWGGGKEFGMLDLKELVELLFRLQSSGDELASQLFEQLPHDLRRAEKDWNWTPPETGTEVKDLGPISQWTKFCFENPSWVSMDGDGVESIRVFSNDSYQGEAFQLIVNRAALPVFLKAYNELTGMPATAITFMLLLHYYRWRNMATIVAGEKSAVGWAFIPATIPH